VSIVVDILLLQTVSIAVASAGVFLAAIYYILQIRHQTKLRQMDLLMRLYSAFTSKELTEAGLVITSLEIRGYDDFVEKYGMPSAEEPVWTALYMGINYLNEVGMLLHRGFIDIESVDELFGYRVAVFWEKLKPLIEGWRKQLNPQVAEWFEYLYDEMKKKEQKLQSKT
jgi:hypothetical protein